MIWSSLSRAFAPLKKYDFLSVPVFLPSLEKTAFSSQIVSSLTEKSVILSILALQLGIEQEYVLADASRQLILACAAVKPVVARRALQHVIALKALKDVAAIRAVQDIAGIGAKDDRYGIRNRGRSSGDLDRGYCLRHAPSAIREGHFNADRTGRRTEYAIALIRDGSDDLLNPFGHAVLVEREIQFAVGERPIYASDFKRIDKNDVVALCIDALDFDPTFSLQVQFFEETFRRGEPDGQIAQATFGGKDRISARIDESRAALIRNGVALESVQR
jgi:hypothetical protein